MMVKLKSLKRKLTFVDNPKIINKRRVGGGGGGEDQASVYAVLREVATAIDSAPSTNGLCELCCCMEKIYPISSCFILETIPPKAFTSGNFSSVQAYSFSLPQSCLQPEIFMSAPICTNSDVLYLCSFVLLSTTKPVHAVYPY